MVDTQSFKQRKIKFKPMKKFKRTTNIYDLFIELKLAIKVRVNELYLFFKRANHYRITYFLCALHLRYTDIKKCLTKYIRGHEEE